MDSRLARENPPSTEGEAPCEAHPAHRTAIHEPPADSHRKRCQRHVHGVGEHDPGEGDALLFDESVAVHGERVHRTCTEHQRQGCGEHKGSAPIRARALPRRARDER